jgi:thiamine pyrophosphokinase
MRKIKDNIVYIKNRIKSKMKLPLHLLQSKEWTFVGPMGPEMPATLLTHSVLAVDGGADFCHKMDVWVGDGDSVSKSLDCQHIYKFPSQKSDSDLALALKLIAHHPQVTIHLWGFLGGRKDHELLNFGEILSFFSIKQQSQALFYHSDGSIGMKCLSQGNWDLDYRGVFSLVSPKDVVISLTGSCQYNIPEPTTLPALSSLGLSNIGEGKFQLQNLGPIIIYFIGDHL